MNGCSNGFSGVTECSTVQIIEPNNDLLVDTAGTRSDMDERGDVVLTDGQTSVSVTFLVPKLNAGYHFEYLYIDALGNIQPGGIQIVPTVRTTTGFTVLLAGTPIGAGYILHWRVTVVATSTVTTQIDLPEDQLIQLPMLEGPFLVTFLNPRSGTSYGFTELRVENLVDPPHQQTPISVQVYVKNTYNFGVNINPRPPTPNYYLRIRTP